MWSKKIDKQLPKKKYRERGQLARRNHLGLLEKSKDYKVRSKAFHAKEDKLLGLKLKAALKNPDEFYHKMIKSKLQHVELSDEDEVDAKEYSRIVKGKNQNMVKLQLYRDIKGIEKMEKSLHLIDAPRMNQKTIFVDCKEDLDNRVLNTNNTLPVDSSLNFQNINQLAGTAKNEYKKLADRITRKEKMTNMFLKIDSDKNMLV